MKITRSDRTANLVEYCPVWKYLQSLDYKFCKLYVPSGLLPGVLPFRSMRRERTSSFSACCAGPSNCTTALTMIEKLPLVRNTSRPCFSAPDAIGRTI
eukprot:IDg10232t1